MDDVVISLTKKQVISATDSIADIACWFQGFKAARGDADLPPGLNDLIAFNATLKDKLWDAAQTK